MNNNRGVVVAKLIKSKLQLLSRLNQRIEEVPICSVDHLTGRIRRVANKLSTPESICAPNESASSYT